MNKVRIWDIPTRLFHWTLVLLVSVSFYTGLNGGIAEMDYHMLSGYAVLACICFRIGWGFMGGKYARFTQFVKGPRAVYTSIRQLFDRDSPSYPGHNPLGALSIIAMLVILLVQAITGLFSNDDILLEGPLVPMVSYETSRELTGIHKFNKWLIGGLIALHLTAIAFHRIVKDERLVLPMINGIKKLDITEPPTPLRLEIAKGIILILICSALVYALVTWAW